jgi:hypothetical protein
VICFILRHYAIVVINKAELRRSLLFGAAAGIRTRVVCVAGRYLTRLDYGRKYPSYTNQWGINLLSRNPKRRIRKSRAQWTLIWNGIEP